MVAVIILVQTDLLIDLPAFSYLSLSSFIFLLLKRLVWTCFGAVVFLLLKSPRNPTFYTNLPFFFMISTEAAAIRSLDTCWLSLSFAVCAVLLLLSKAQT